MKFRCSIVSISLESWTFPGRLFIDKHFFAKPREVQHAINKQKLGEDGLSMLQNLQPSVKKVILQSIQ